MQFTLKVILNPTPDEFNFFNSILSSPHDILTKGVEDDEAQMDVDKDDLEEAHAATTFVKLNGVFDKAPHANEVPEQSVPQS